MFLCFFPSCFLFFIDFFVQVENFFQNNKKAFTPPQYELARHDDLSDQYKQNNKHYEKIQSALLGSLPTRLSPVIQLSLVIQLTRC